MKITAIVGAGYGDEGKGLATDFFCSNANRVKTLNIKVNGGAQASHTVCRLVKNENNGKIDYKHWVFKQYGSGTFAGADTFVADTFMLNIPELLKERELLRGIYHQRNTIYIDRGCRVTLPINIILNQYVEDSRTHRHGSCGLGIYETFHMNNDVEKVTLNDIINWFTHGEKDNLLNELNRVSIKYLDFRREELKTRDNIEIDDNYYKIITEEIQKQNKDLQDKLVDMVKYEDIVFCGSSEGIIRSYRYENIVFECSQGLELDQFNERNFPHLTPSNTGLRDILKLTSENYMLRHSEIEVCFVTRSYKTKHGAGIFVEEDNNIQSQYGLYDRTNQPNEYQGTLKYGLINIGRMKKLIMDQVDLFEDESETNTLKTSMLITHLDQTNSSMITTCGKLDIDDISIKTFGLSGRILKSYGEKASDIIG